MSNDKTVTTPVSVHSFDKYERAAIDRFISIVERKAEEKMLKTGKLEGAHYAAMKEMQKEMRND